VNSTCKQQSYLQVCCQLRLLLLQQLAEAAHLHMAAVKVACIRAWVQHLAVAAAAAATPRYLYMYRKQSAIMRIHCYSTKSWAWVLTAHNKASSLYSRLAAYSLH
jgi:transcriptional antiterminator Rof (Rho-off)